MKSSLPITYDIAKRGHLQKSKTISDVNCQMYVNTKYFPELLKDAFQPYLKWVCYSVLFWKLFQAGLLKRTLIDYACSRIKAAKAVKTGMCSTTEALKKARLRG